MIEKGAQMAVLSGDPSKSGEFVIRLKVPANYRVAADHHLTDEYATVIEGNFSLGMGDNLNETKGAALTPGGFAMAPASVRIASADLDAVAWRPGRGPTCPDQPSRGRAKRANS